MSLEINFPENLRKIRQQRGYRTSSDLSGALCAHGYICSDSAVRSWETGYRSPSLQALAALCDLLEVSSDELIFGKLKK